MKIISLLFCIPLLMFVLKSSAVETEGLKGKPQIGITYSSFGSNDLVGFDKMIGGASYQGNGFFTLGITYLYPINKTFDFETGIEYSKHSIIIEPYLPLIYHGKPVFIDFSLFTLPATLRVTFLKYFFVNGGLFLGFGGGNSTSVANQNGVGINLGLGLKYDFKRNLSLFVNPYTKVHSLIPFTSVEARQRLFESGFRFGILIRLHP